MGKSGKKRSKDEASPNSATDPPDKEYKLATNTPPASIATLTATAPLVYGTPAASGPFMPPNLQYVAHQTPTQYSYMYAPPSPASPQNIDHAQNTTHMDSAMYNTILSKLHSIEATQIQVQNKLSKLDQIEIDVNPFQISYQWLSQK